MHARRACCGLLRTQGDTGRHAYNHPISAHQTRNMRPMTCAAWVTSTQSSRAARVKDYYCNVNVWKQDSDQLMAQGAICSNHSTAACMWWAQVLP